MYTEKVMEYFKNPLHAGKIIDADATGKVGNPKCGDVMEIFLKIKDGIIVEIKFQTFGCAAAISASEALCRLAEGKTISEAKKISNKDIADHLEGLPPLKLHCSVLGAEALHKAIENYENREKS